MGFSVLLGTVGGTQEGGPDAGFARTALVHTRHPSAITRTTFTLRSVWGTLLSLYDGDSDTAYLTGLL